MRAALLAVCVLLPAAAWAGPRVADGFEGAALDERVWSPKDVRYGDGVADPQLTFTAAESRCGRQAARVTMGGADPGRACAGRCQRAEVWQAPPVRAAWGEETWYGFSIRVAGGAPSGSRRTILGQWKTPSDRSPFVAERYDNRVFHLTVETGDRYTPPGQGAGSVRRTIACAVGDPEALVALQARLATLDPADRRTVAELEAYRDQAVADLAAGAYTPAQETEDGDTPRRIGSYLAEFACIQDPVYYMRPARVAIAPGEAPVLPDPAAGWVDLAFGIRGGHQDSTAGPNEGRVEVWANGRHVVTMTGDLDVPLAPGEARSVYFKFGIYRDADLRDDALLIDEFRQGASREEVAPGCPRP